MGKELSSFKSIASIVLNDDELLVINGGAEGVTCGAGCGVGCGAGCGEGCAGCKDKPKPDEWGA